MSSSDEIEGPVEQDKLPNDSRRGRMQGLLGVALPRRLVVHLPPLGDLILRPRLCHADSSAPSTESFLDTCEQICLDCLGVPGVLLVEKRFAMGLVNAALGFSPALVGGPMSRIERGVLHGLLAASLGRIGPFPGLRLSKQAGGELPQAPMVIEAIAELNGDRGVAWVLGSVDFVEHTWAAQVEASEVRPRLGFELARTTLSRAEIAAANSGDTLVFDETAAFHLSEAWPISVRLHGDVVAASLAPNGRVHIADDLVMHVAQCPTRHADPTADENQKEPEGLVEVTAELSELELDGRVLAALLQGDGLSLNRESAVALTVGGKVWAVGTRVEVDGNFAVLLRKKPAD